MAPSLVFPPNLKHPFFIENITSPSGSSLKDLSVWGFSPAKVASQCLQVYCWDRRGREKSEWRRLGFESCLLRYSPPTAISSPSSSLMPFYSKSQVGRALGPGAKMPLHWHQQRVRWGPQPLPVPLKTQHGQGLVEVKVSVQSLSSPVYLLRSVVFAVQGELVWVFECRCLLFFKGLLALPWGYCSRNSYLCFSPAYRLLTGTKWKTPAHSVLSVNMFPRHGSGSVPRCSVHALFIRF